jgi:hypothetical protein
MNTMVVRYANPNGASRYAYIGNMTNDVRIMTNVTAVPMPTAESSLREVSRNWQSPRNLVRI